MLSTNINVLLATYNGESYLDKLLNSLLRQDYNNFSILVRDDASSDDTNMILLKWSRVFGQRMKILPDSGHTTLGFVGNFSRLLNESSAPYIMLADQDDVWDPNKIRLTMEAMHLRESQLGNNYPILVHTDLRVCNQDLSLRALSYWHHQGILPQRGHDLGHVIIENIASGCTLMLNRPLVDLLSEIPPEAQYHDWWIALVAAAFGEIVSLEKQTISWRRHNTNNSEVTSLYKSLWRTITLYPKMRQRLLELLSQRRPRTRTFLAHYRSTLSTEQKAVILAFIRLPNYGYLTRRIILIKHRLLFTSWLRSIGMLLLI